MINKLRMLRKVVTVLLLAVLVCAQAQPTITPATLIEVNEGEDATFNCSEIIPQSQFTVEIQRPGDTGFSTIPISDPQLSVEEVGTTAVYTYGPVVRTEDGSLLRCNLGGIPSSSSTMRVYYRAEYTDPGPQVVPENMIFSLDLNLTANPIPTDYQWQKDSVNISNGGRFTLTVNQISIDDALRTDAGTYNLTSTNRAGTGSVSFDLQVHYAPELVSSLGTLGAECDDSESVIVCTIMTGTNGTLECSAVGSPPPDYDVTSNADVQTNIVLDAVIEITSAVPPNTGLYSCSVSNSVGSVSRVYQLNVGTIPVPANLAAVTSGNNVVVSWELSGDPGVLEITYRITFTATTALTYEETATNTENVTIALTNLVTDTQYNITVEATNLLGTSAAITTTYTTPVDCGEPTLPAKASIQSTNGTTEGSVVIYRCDPGLIPDEDNMIVCTAGGNWSPDPSEVVCRADCGYPDPPVNGSFGGDIPSTVEGSEVTYQCDDGLTPEGNMTAVCGEDGEWRPNPGDVECRKNDTLSTAVSSGGLDGGEIAGIVVPLVLLVACVTLIAVIAVLVWKKRSGKYHIPSQQLNQSGIEMENRYIEDDKPAPQSNGAQPPPVIPLAQYSEVQESSDQPPLAQYSDVQLKPPEQHPQGLMYADLNIMKKSEISQPPEIQNPVQYSAILPAGHRVPSSNRPAPSQPAPHPADSSLNLDSLLIQLKEVEGDWKELGECFGISPSQLDEIASHCLTATDSMIEVVDLWLREYPGRPTWREVAEALKQLHHYRLAEDINNVYSTGSLPRLVDNRVPSLSNNTHSEPPPPRPPREDVNAPPSMPSISSHHHKPPPRPPKGGVKPAVEKPPQRPPKTPPQQKRREVQEDPDAPPVPPKLYTEEEVLPPRPPKPHPRK